MENQNTKKIGELIDNWKKEMEEQNPKLIKNNMEREIWDIVKALDEKKLTAIEAHKKITNF